MPDLQFVLPHWLYWAGLIVFPLSAMALVKWQGARGPLTHVSLPIGYLLLVTAGFIGAHRFYVRDWRGVMFLPLLAAIIYANGEIRDARELRSIADSDVQVAQYDVEYGELDVADGREGAEVALVSAREGLVEAQESLAVAEAGMRLWSTAALYVAIAVALFLLLDAVLLPGMVRRCRAVEGEVAPPGEVTDEGLPPNSHHGLAGILEAVTRLSGEFVAYWSVIAVFAYYYEVIARYIFNSPTNWVHEGMFLMFGMQYLISGAYAYMADSHVRVDVFYARLSVRGKAITDLMTSVFFFVFAGTLLVTGWTFMMDSFEVGEVSFTEWAIQYWPVKITIVLGAALILLQGLAKMLADLQLAMRAEA